LLVGAYFVLVVVLFAVFYPAISGIPISVYWRDGLRWFRSWAF
jgi:dolichyl-phosphate-mannose--protein O-mannosyl transferase